ncbi:MAG TPA: sodium:solute symporter family protein [bacterium]|nr:sodium:solute symporter family protein [bacterium]
MLIGTIDWVIIGGFFAVILLIGYLASRGAGKNSKEFFLSGRRMPWWLLGTSMVATTFSTDTPNLVTDIVRSHGVSGNWKWWAFLLTGMLTVFVYAKLWRRSEVMTDIEFYEIRYSGKLAAFLRGFRALYLGVFFNVMIMATVSLAAVKIGAVLFNFTPLQSLAVAMIVTVIYAGLGGLSSVVFNDFFLFTFAMAGAVAAAVYAVKMPEVGGLQGLFTHPAVSDKLNLIPNFSTKAQFLNNFVPLMLIPIAVQWWSVWYPGAEPGGGGYMVQRMLSAKDEKNATGATLFFNVAHYAIRPWPWIIVGLASVIVFPDLQAIHDKFPHIADHYLKNDIAYPAMLSFIPHGFLGVVIASLIAAYMSTMASQLNWGSSYIVNDFYKRFIDPEADEKRLVTVGRVSTVLLMLMTALVALVLQNALQAFEILLQIGAGTGLIFILRWFWWRINAATELAGMIVSFIVAVMLKIVLPKFGIDFPHWQELLLGVSITTVIYFIVTFLTQPADLETLKSFYRKVRPGGNGWNAVLKKAKAQGDPIKRTAKEGDLPLGIMLMVAGCFAVYSTVFAAGYYMYTNFVPAVICTVIAVVSFFILFKKLPQLDML